MPSNHKQQSKSKPPAPCVAVSPPREAPGTPQPGSKDPQPLVTSLFQAASLVFLQPPARAPPPLPLLHGSIHPARLNFPLVSRKQPHAGLTWSHSPAEAWEEGADTHICEGN